VRDAQRRGIEVHPPHINVSAAKCAVEDGAVRVGLGYVRSVGERRQRQSPPPSRTQAWMTRPPCAAGRDALEALVASGACDVWANAGDRHRQAAPNRRALLWQLGLTPRPSAGQLVLPIGPTTETPELPHQTDWQRMLADYRHTTLSVGIHPLELLRPHLPGVLASNELVDVPHRARIAVAGWRSHGSAPQPRTASSSCCSRTNTASST